MFSPDSSHSPSPSRCIQRARSTLRGLAVLLIVFLLAIGLFHHAPLKHSSKHPSRSGRDYSYLFAGARRMVLPNGMVVITREMHNAPVVSVEVYYRVGRRDETPGMEGMAHLVEHMMFRGTRSRSTEQIRGLLDTWGNTFNGLTRSDYTLYYETVPAVGLESMLRFEADRMVNCAFDPAVFENEKRVVEADVQQRNTPEMRLYDAVLRTAYRIHPYGRGGLDTQIAAVPHLSLDGTRQFYRQYYNPGNAILVLSGDFNTSATQRLVTSLFGPIPVRTLPVRPVPVEPPQMAERRIRIQGGQESSRIEIAYHVGSISSYDEVALDVIAHLLGGGSRSRLAEEVQFPGDSGPIDSIHSSLRDPGLFIIRGVVPRNRTPTLVERAVLAQVERLKVELVSKQELMKQIAMDRAALIKRGETASGVGTMIGFGAIEGEENYARDYLSRLKGVTASQIRDIARRYFTPRNRTVGWLVGAEDETNNTGRSVRLTSPAEQTTTSSEPMSESTDVLTPASGSTSEPFQLSAAEQAGLFRMVKHPPLFRQVLPNGLVVMVCPRYGYPGLSVVVVVDAGAMRDYPGRAGLARCVADLSDWNTRQFSAADIDWWLRSRGATLGHTSYRDHASYTVGCLAVDGTELTKILADVVCKPRFSARDLDSLRRNMANEDDADLTNGPMVAYKQFMAALYPESYTYHWPERGTQATRNRITVEDLEQFHRRYYRPDRTMVTVVGDITPEQAFLMVKAHFGAWQAPTIPAASPVPSLSGRVLETRVFTPLSGNRLATVVMGCRGPSRKDPNSDTCFLLDQALKQQLFSDLRDRAGLVYSIDVDTDTGVGAGAWYVSLACRPQDVDRCIAQVKTMLKQFRERLIAAAEMRRLQAKLVAVEMLATQTNNVMAGSIAAGAQYGLGMDYLWTFPRQFQSITPEQIRSLARRLIDPDNMVISIAGPVDNNAGPAADDGVQAIPGPNAGARVK